MKKSTVDIGEVIGAVGINGYLKVKTFLSESKIIEKLGLVFFDDKKKLLKVKFIREHKKNAIISLQSIDDRNKAKALIGKKLFINRNQLPSLKKNEYYLRDLLGMVVKNFDNTKLGVVKNIKNFGAEDLIEVYQKNNKYFFLPINNQNIKNVDLKNQIIIVNSLKGITP